MSELEGLWKLNFARIAQSIKEYPEQYNCHWLWRAAVAAPMRMQVWKYEEKDITYVREALYNPYTKIMRTNMIGCPVSYNHHIGSTCDVCGLKD